MVSTPWAVALSVQWAAPRAEKNDKDFLIRVFV
jgi:hypothetical protein